LKPFNRFFLPALGWFILSTFLLTIPGDTLPSGGFFGRIPGFDKYVHIGLFGILALLTGRWVLLNGISREKQNRYLIICGFACLVYGIIMEFIQKEYVPNRSFDIGDIFADAGGSLLGIIFTSRVYTKK
jgi:VanZ family protein